MRLNGKSTTRLLFSYSRRRSYPTTPAVTRGGCMFMGCIHLPWPTVLRWQHSALYGNFKRKPLRPRPLCTDCWMDLRWLHVDCYHDSRATETCPSFQHLCTAVTVLIQSDCTRSLTLSVYYFVSNTTYFIIVMDTGDVEDGNNTASVSIKFNVVQCEHCTLSLINTFAAESWIAEYKTYAKIACICIHHVVYQTRVLLLFTLKVIFTGRYFLLLLK